MNDLDKSCWFCQRSSADADSALTVELHRLLRRTQTWVVFGIQHKSEFEKVQIQIPRCKACTNVHSRYAGISLFLYLIVVAFACNHWVWRSSNTLDQKVIGTILMLVAGSVVFLPLALFVRPRSIRDTGNVPQHPSVAALLSDGWELGESPTYKGNPYEREESVYCPEPNCAQLGTKLNEALGRKFYQCSAGHQFSI